MNHDITKYTCNEQRDNSRPLKVYRSEEDVDKIVINKDNTQMGIVLLENDAEIDYVIRQLCIIRMCKQDQSRKFCPACKISLE